MSIGYIATFVEPSELEDLVKSADSEDGVDEDLIARLNDESEIWGGHNTHCLYLCAVTNWLSERSSVPEHGSKLGDQLVTEHIQLQSLIHWVVSASDQIELKSKISTLDPISDPSFELSLKKYFTDLGEEGYLDEGLDDYYQMFDDLRAALGSQGQKTLLILIPC